MSRLHLARWTGSVQGSGLIGVLGLVCDDVDSAADGSSACVQTILLRSSAISASCLSSLRDSFVACTRFNQKPSPFSSERITTLQGRGPSRTFENQLHLITLATQDMTLIDHRLQNGGLFTFCRFYRSMLCIRGTSHGPVSVSVCVCHKSEFY